MNDGTEPDGTVLDRIRGAVRRIRRAIAGDSTGDGREYEDPRTEQLKAHEREKINDFVELAEEKGRDGDQQEGDEEP